MCVWLGGGGGGEGNRRVEDRLGWAGGPGEALRRSEG